MKTMQNHFKSTAILFLALLSLIVSPINLHAVEQNDKDLLIVAQNAFDDGFYDVAMRYVQQLLTQYPQTNKRVEANLLLGQCYFFQNQYLKAYEIFNSLLNNAEYKDAVLFWIGETHLKGADYQKAEEYFKQLIEVYPNSKYTSQGYYSLGWVYYDQNDYDKAHNYFSQLVSRFPADQFSEDASFKIAEIEYNKKEYEKAIDKFKEHLDKYPQSTHQAESNFYIAEAFYYLSKFPEAIVAYTRVAETSFDPKLILMAKVSLGWSYLKLEKSSIALEKFNDALKYGEEKGVLTDDVYLGLASLYSQMNDPEKAKDSYKSLIKSFPNSQRINEAYLGEANAYYMLKQYDSAVKAYQLLIDSNKEKKFNEIVEKAYFGMAWSYLKSGNIDTSIELFEKIKGLSENKIVKISALTQIGDAYQDINQFEKAIGIYDQILKDYPDSIYTDYVQYRQGIALLKMDHLDMAALSFQSLQNNFPKSNYLNDTHYYLAVIFFKQNNWSLAKEEIEHFIKNLPETHEFLPEAQQIYGLSLYNLKEYPEAIKIFQKIIKNYPGQSSLLHEAEFYIAKITFNLGNTSEAIKRFTLIMNKYTDSQVGQDSVVWLADYYRQNNDLTKAISYYKSFLEKFPSSNDIEGIRYELGQTLRINSQFDEAIAVLREISGIKNPILYAQARLLIAAIFSEDLSNDEAITTYQNIIETSPEYKRDAQIKLAKIYQKKKNYPATLENFTSALKASSKLSQVGDAEIQFNIADTFETMNQIDKAIENYLKIPYLYKNEDTWIIKAYLRMARIFENQENWEKATITYKKILDLHTDESKYAQERLDWISENTINHPQ